MSALALAWFVCRVIPKPIRATYPCQQAAFPLASAFVVWLLGLKSGLLAWLGLGERMKRIRPWLATLCFMSLSMLVAWGAVKLASSLKPNAYPAPQSAVWSPTDPANSPMGVARGIFPGRVVWARDPSSVSYDGTNGYWWHSNFTSQAKVDAMASQSLRSLTGANSDNEAWDMLFHHYNKTHGKGDTGYQPGQVVALKINQNTARYTYAGNGNTNQNTINGSPHLILAMVRQLVSQAGVAPSNIMVYDAVRFIPDAIYIPCHAEFPDVRFMDGYGTNGRVLRTWTATNIITYAVANLCGSKIPTQVRDASYIINMAIMKSHGGDGPTLNAKNHYGSINARDHNWIKGINGMAAFNPIVDLMGNKHLGEKTMLFMIDTLYGANGADAVPSKWKMAPFNTNWPGSLFISQDNVAIDSVGFDFQNAEWGCPAYTDNLLHEAAMANNPPSGLTYAPNGDGQRLPSLGVHEHWNSSTAKQYSRNLSTNGTGIELVALVISTRNFSIAITTPANGDTLLAGANLEVRSAITNSSSTVRRVEYLTQRTGLLGTTTNAPFNLLWTNVPAGPHALQAVAYDTDGYAATSAVVNILVLPLGLVTAGTLHVDLRASDSSAGAATWTNRGSLGDFIRNGTPLLNANVANTAIAGVQFKGNPDAYIGPLTTSDLDGASSRSIEVWVLNNSPYVAEETLVSMGYRGTSGRVCSMIYGTNVSYGAMSQWSSNYDLGWGSISNIPMFGAWHHLVYTYDGNTNCHYYVDGILSTNRFIAAPLNTHTNETILLGAQHGMTNNSPPTGQFFSGYLNAVRIHCGVLSASDVAINYAVGPSPVQAPATFLAQPQSRTNYAGTTVRFSATPNDCGPFTVQWLRESGALASQTNLLLQLTNVQPADAGVYRVSLANAFNCITSLPASLTIWPPPKFTGRLTTQSNHLCLGLPPNLGGIALLASSNLVQWQEVTNIAVTQGACELPLPRTNGSRQFFKLRFE
jgi:hypothetical protein